MIKPFKHITKDFFVGNLGMPEFTDEINEKCDKVLNNKDIPNVYEVPARVSFDDDGVSLSDTKVRKCTVAGLDVSEFNFIESGLSQIVKNANQLYWNLSLENQWNENIQYIKYNDKGDFFNWHQDAYGNLFTDRKITVVYCLSHKSDYVGAEFQIKTENSTYTRKFDYGDFIVFPANRIHRVKSLKSGKRITLVGWYR